jgi:hypothetical protein
VYCGDRADSRDHVPPKLLLERPLPSTLNTVWACAECNQGASRDEQYLLTLISHVSSAASLSARIDEGGSVDRAFDHDATLEEELLRSLEVDPQTGRVFVNVDLRRVERVLRKIARGLFVLRFGRAVPAQQLGRAALYPYDMEDTRPPGLFRLTFTERFAPKGWTVVQPGVFSYTFVRAFGGDGVSCVMNLHNALWGVVDMPHPLHAKPLGGAQGWLFPELKGR